MGAVDRSIGIRAQLEAPIPAEPTEHAAGLLPQLRSLGVPVTENVGELSYVQLQTREDSPEGRTQTAPYEWWRLHDEYEAAPARGGAQ